MLTDYNTKMVDPPYTKKPGPRKKFGSYISFNLETYIHETINTIAIKNNETVSDFVRRSIKKEIERSK